MKKHEIEQANRVKQMIIDFASQHNWEFVYFFEAVPYHCNYNRDRVNDWMGEVDLLVLSKHHFIVFELKQKIGYIRGTTRNRSTMVQYPGQSNLHREKSFFHQCSRMKYYFSQEYYPEIFKPREECRKDQLLHPDVVLLFPNSTKIDFWYTPPLRYDTEEFNKLINSCKSIDDRDFLKNYFDWDSRGAIHRYNQKAVKKDLIKLENIFDRTDLIKRVEKWFYCITEEKISEKLISMGSDTFIFTPNDGMEFAADFQLNPI